MLGSCGGREDFPGAVAAEPSPEKESDLSVTPAPAGLLATPALSGGGSDGWTSNPPRHHLLNRTPRHRGCGHIRSDQGATGTTALAESAIRLYKSELILNRGPWRTVEDVDLVTLAWVHWWNTIRLHSAIGNMPPAEFEAAHYAHQQSALEAGIH